MILIVSENPLLTVQNRLIDSMITRKSATNLVPESLLWPDVNPRDRNNRKIILGNNEIHC
jgi:hypothetical protein